MAKREAKYPRVEVANKYARDIVAGRIPACRYVKLACQRHLDDLAASRDRERNYPYRFDPEAAERKLDLIELLPHTKGEWGFKRQLVTLEPWQKFGLACTFGWKHRKSGLRRFRESYWEVCRKNGKSVIAAGVGLSMFVLDDEFGAEVYSGATTEKQAWEVFRPARLMVKRSPMLVEAAGIEVNASNMNLPEDGSRFEPLIGNPGDGASPSCAIIDEYHEHDSASLYETMLTGMGARKQPLVLIITTAGANIEGPCYDKRREVIEMLEGITPNDELFGWIFTIDEGDDWTKPEVLAKANPNMGISVYREYLESQQQKAIRTARFTNIFKTKHLNVWTSAKAGYFNLESWKACEDRTLELEQFEGQQCILGLDLARKLDLNAMARLFFRDIDGRRHYYSVAPRFWVPEDTVNNSENRRMAERYQAWVNGGSLTATDGAEVDYREILEEAKDANRLAPVLFTPLDPHGATNLAHQLDDEGLTPVTITQNYTNLSDPMKEMEAAIMSGRFHHDGNPIMTWCVSNVIGKHIPGNDDVVRPIKQGDDNKIDGAVALIMAIGRAMANDGTGNLDEFLSNPIMA
jgi:phage terminase large subunit-like protein